MLNIIEDHSMVNHINDSANLKPIDSDKSIKSKSLETRETRVDSAPIFADHVSLSHTSKQLEALKASLRDEPEINEARVLYFKAEIQAGTYQINDQKIAMNMCNIEMA